MKSLEDVKEAIALNISMFKEESGMNNTDIAEISGIHVNTVRRCLMGEGQTSIYLSYLLSNAMGLTLEQFISKPEGLRTAKIGE